MHVGAQESLGGEQTERGPPAVPTRPLPRRAPGSRPVPHTSKGGMGAGGGGRGRRGGAQVSQFSFLDRESVYVPARPRFCTQRQRRMKSMYKQLVTTRGAARALQAVLGCVFECDRVHPRNVLKSHKTCHPAAPTRQVERATATQGCVALEAPADTLFA